MRLTTPLYSETGLARFGLSFPTGNQWPHSPTTWPIVAAQELLTSEASGSRNRNVHVRAAEWTLRMDAVDS